MKISQTTARTISPVIKGMAQAGSLPKTEANAVVSILQEACKTVVNSSTVKSKTIMLTTAQAALRLGVCVKTVLRMRAEGKLKGVNLTGSHKSLRFPETEIEKFINTEV